MEGRQTWLLRPAVEGTPENHNWRGPENRFVEGLRDTLLAWLDHDPTNASSYVEAMLDSGTEIVERVAIYLVDRRFDLLQACVAKATKPAFFDLGHHHELYHLLKHHFSAFPDEIKSATFVVIEHFALPDREENSKAIQERNQRLWLSTISGQGYAHGPLVRPINARSKLRSMIAAPRFHRLP